MTTKPDLSGYESWLTEEGYQGSTVEVTLRRLKVVAATPKTAADHVPHVRRYLRYVASARRHPLGREFALAMKAKGLKPAAEIQKQGSRDREVLTVRQWKALRARLRRTGGDDIDKLLVAYMESPYRISAFLKLDAGSITKKDVTDKWALEWIRRRSKTLHFHNGIWTNFPLYKILCDTSRCAYSRLRTRLSDVLREMNIDADLDTLYKSYNELMTEGPT